MSLLRRPSLIDRKENIINEHPDEDLSDDSRKRNKKSYNPPLSVAMEHSTSDSDESWRTHSSSDGGNYVSWE